MHYCIVHIPTREVDVITGEETIEWLYQEKDRLKGEQCVLESEISAMKSSLARASKAIDANDKTSADALDALNELLSDIFSVRRGYLIGQIVSIDYHIDKKQGDL